MRTDVVTIAPGTSHGSRGMKWIDVINPSREELLLLADEHNLHANSIQDCLDPEHLPKYENLETSTFVILRAFDERSSPKDDEVQKLTRKIAIFLTEDALITLHRQEQTYLDQVKKKYKGLAGSKSKSSPKLLKHIVFDVINAAVQTFEKPLEDAETRIHHFEGALLSTSDVMGNWESIFQTKCQLMTIKRLFWHTSDTVQKMVPFAASNQPAYQDLREQLDSLRFFVDSLLDDLNSLLNIQMSLAAHKTNQVVRYLTLFSVFFMPITFIVGVYGMNFRYMPELDSRVGYPLVWGAIITSVVSTYFWFKRRGLI